MEKKKTKELNIKIKLPQRLEKCLNCLEKISGKSKEFIFYEALIRYIEDMEDIQRYSVLKALGELDKIRKQKTYTTEELNKRLGI